MITMQTNRVTSNKTKPMEAVKMLNSHISCTRLINGLSR